jgi:hypothetical protein
VNDQQQRHFADSSQCVPALFTISTRSGHDIENGSSKTFLEADAMLANVPDFFCFIPGA